MLVKCHYCSKEFDKKDSEAIKYNKHFCSRKHYFSWQKENLKKRVIVRCTNCGTNFERNISRYRGKNAFCSRKCQYEFHRMDNAPAYKGGRLVNDHGYIMVLSPKHPRKVAGQYVYEHIKVMEDSLGRYLKNDEVVHHINGIKDDNRLENLQVLSPSEHTRLHKTIKTKSELNGNIESVAEMTAPAIKSE